MGEVYKAYDPSLDRVVALKTIRPEVQDEGLLGRFRREGRAAGRLRHPRIVTVYDLGEIEGTTFMAMEYLEGRSLAAEIRQGQLTFEARVQVLLELLDGLAYAHQNGVIHRDIKPANIQVLPDSSIKILDFGVARLATAESLSHTGSVVGTVLYMCPEQLRAERVDGRADVYSVGVVAYELLSGRRPFEGQSLTEIVLKVINEPAPPMNCPWLVEHPRLEEVVRVAMAKSPTERFATAAAMASALGEAIGLPRPTPATTAPPLSGSATPTVILPRRPDPVSSGGAEPREPSRLATSTPTVRQGTAPGNGVRKGPLQPGQQDGRAWKRGAAAAVAVGLVAASGLLARRTLDPSQPMLASAAKPPLTSPANPVPTTPATGTIPPQESAPSVPSPPDEATAPQAGRHGEPAPEQRARGGVFVAGEPRVASAVAAALRSKRCSIAATTADAAFVLRVAWTVDLRPAPLGTGAARTADYAATADLTGPRRSRQSFDFDGHVMEVGESVTLAAARRDLAARIADAAAPAIAGCRP